MSNERIRAERGEDWPDDGNDYPVLLKGEALTWGVRSVRFSAAERADAFIDQINGAPAAPSEGDGRPDRGDEVQIAGSIGNIVRVNDREGTCEIAWWMPSGGPGFGESSSVEVPLAGLHVRQQATTSRSTPAPSPSQPEPGTLDEPMISVAEANRVLADERAMHAAFRPEVVAEVAVQLSEEADWEEIARWCGGTLRYSGDPSGEVTTYLDLPGSGSVCQGMWITLDHAGRFRARAEIAPPAPPAVPGDRPATELAPAMHVIRRADGDEMGEFAFFATDGPDGWDVAENTDHDEDTVYEILACYPVARRKMLCSTLCPTCDGEGEDGIGTMCPSCGGSGEHEAPDAEHLMIHVYADAQPAHPAPDGARERFAASLDRIGADQSVKDAHAATDSPSGDGASR